MKKHLMVTALAALLGSGGVSAAPFVLDFEGAGNLAALNGFYNGGTDSLGNSGFNYGVGFGANALTIIDSDVGGTGNIGNEPSGNTVLFFLTGSAVLNYGAGFSDGFSFFYTTTGFGGEVRVYDGLDATGNLLGSLTIDALGVGPGDPTGDFSNWRAVGLAFAGTARSIDFGGTVNQVGYDDVTFGSANPGNPVPEPTSLALLGAALGGLLLARRRAV